ncbi:MAG: hypothetical protein AAFQ84_06115, partial [Pseudomonadota bacterium]
MATNVKNLDDARNAREGVEVQDLSIQAYRRIEKSYEREATERNEASEKAKDVLSKAKDEFGLHVEAFKLVQKMRKRDPLASQAFKRELDKMWEYAGLNDQLDLEDAVDAADDDEDD